MTAVRTGCAGFVAARREYVSRLDLVEVQQTFYQPPKVTTAARWREEAPAPFAFTLKAWQLITHEPTSPTYRRLSRPIPPALAGRYGSFRDTDEVAAAWEATRAVAEALAASAILFQCPASFTPTEEHKANLRRFFARLPRGGPLFAFEPRGVWEAEETAELCRDLDLLHAVDPLRDGAPSAPSPVAYFRLHGPATGRYRYSDEDLRELRLKCEDHETVYCLFNNVEMWKDANRFVRLLRDEAG
jgi:uncharacterized protein YecE (DUF72 family)